MKAKAALLYIWRCYLLLPVFFTFSLLYSSSSFSQFEHRLISSNMLAEIKFNYGFLYAQHLELELFNSHLTAFEFTILQETYGKYKWERNYAYPLIGMTFLYSGLGKSTYLGDAYALFPFIDFPLYRHKNFMFNFRFGLGVGYITKKFDRLSDYKDLAIGSHLNAAVSLMFEARYRLTSRVMLSGGFNLQHFSNGTLKEPNYGLNLILVNLGVAYRLVRENQFIGDRFIPPTEPFSAIIRRYMEFNIGFAIGYKNMQEIYGENFWIWHLYENTFFQITRKSKVGFGLDLSYDNSHIKILETKGIEVNNKLQILRPGINGAYELLLSKLGFILNLGYYLGGKEKSNGPLYEKISFQYNVSKLFFVNIMLKVHFGRADYIGWGLGYHFLTFYGKKTIK